MRHPRGETVQILPFDAGARDAHGNPVKEWGEPVAYTGCAVAPSNSDEQTEPGRNAVVTVHTVYGPPGMVVSHRDKAICRGETWFVVGIQGVWSNPFNGRTPGVQFGLSRTEG